MVLLQEIEICFHGIISAEDYCSVSTMDIASDHNNICNDKLTLLPFLCFMNSSWYFQRSILQTCSMSSKNDWPLYDLFYEWYNGVDRSICNLNYSWNNKNFIVINPYDTGISFHVHINQIIM